MSGRTDREVSVVIPVRNGARTIGPCVESVLRSDYPESRFEVVVADNGSTDETRAVLERFGDRVRVVREDVRGPAAARNAGLVVAEGEVIAFTDADCEVHPSWIREIVGPLGPGVAAVGGRILAFPDANEIAHFGERVHDHRAAIEDCFPPYVITMNVAVSTELIRSIGGFDTRLLRSEDVDLAYRLADSGRAIVYRDEAIVYHRNRHTLALLAREAWLHGFYNSKMRRIHGERLLQLWDTVPPPEPTGRRSRFSRPLEPERERFLWFWFRSIKRLGKLAGRLGAGDLHHV